MNARLLHASRRCPIGRARIFLGVGQLQPTIISSEQGKIILRIEGISNGRPCWHRLPLATHGDKAKRLFAELESHYRNGTLSPAKLAREQIIMED